MLWYAYGGLTAKTSSVLWESMGSQSNGVSNTECHPSESEGAGEVIEGWWWQDGGTGRPQAPQGFLVTPSQLLQQDSPVPKQYKLRAQILQVAPFLLEIF